ncbi:MAG TPA: phosphoribosylaminoimidazolesuccinocarboxamide synthase, partial [Dehalococcoidia bacterium]|nr:phosphoribosylaminoimidazolesuccinocarboxamide synthase [Dehalococcoidia bacterium]
MDALTETSLPLPLFQRGKVRDIYDLGDELLIVSTDRISALDFVLPAGVPEKGRVLNQMSAFWFQETAGIMPNHVVKAIDDVSQLDAYIPAESRFPYPTYLEGRSMVVKKVERVSAECVV